MTIYAHVVGGVVIEPPVDLGDLVPGKDVFTPALAAAMVVCDATVRQGWSYDGKAFAAPAPPAVAPQTVFASRALMQTLFTQAERQAIFQAAQTAAGWQVLEFITYTAATPQIDITSAEFVADIDAIEAAGLLTAARVAQVLAGTAAPTS